MRKQIEFKLNGGSWGGLRIKSGKKRKHSRGVSHESREKINSSTPLHINLKTNQPIRNKLGLTALGKAIINARGYMSILQYSLESNHIHLIVEAENNEYLEKGMRSFTATFVRALKKGKLQSERYHLHVLKTPQEVKNVYRYVLLNHAHHTKSETIKSDGYCSLYMYDLKEISKRWKISIVQSKIIDPIELDSPSSWLAKNFYS